MMGSFGGQEHDATSKMQIERILVYPIKSLRATEVESAVLTKHGVAFDRCFMLLRPSRDDAGTISYKNMAITEYNQMVRYATKIRFPADDDADKGEIEITYHPVDGTPEKHYTIPLLPETAGLEEIGVTMHLSSTQAFRMPDECNAWFSDCFGFEAVLVYLGDYRRPVRMSSTNSARLANPANGWLSSFVSQATSLLSSPATADITFSDCAPYLIVSSKSMDDVHRRLPDGLQMDISKFRPNIIISGASDTCPWEEDHWAELSIAGQPVWECVHNCGRCKSVNIDYDTGKQGLGPAGKMLKQLSRDRRVDPGSKWSPIFGRYSFLLPSCEGKVIKLGDEVEVSRRNKERSRFGE